MNNPGARDAARAIDALRRGWPFRVEGADGSLDLLAVESVRDEALAEFAGHDVLLSGERAVTLKLTNQRVAATPGRFDWRMPPIRSPQRLRSPIRRSTSPIR